MRELKFRCWDKVEKIMTIDCDVMEGVWENMLAIQKSENQIIMQYTGLKDKNGEMIFEGDIIEHNQSCVASPIEWDEVMTGFVCEVWCGKQFSTGEVIGNIHQHPELLTPTG